MIRSVFPGNKQSSISDELHIVRGPRVTWNQLINTFPDAWLLLIASKPRQPSTLEIERASPRALEEVEDLENKICYQHIQEFTEPCENCPVIRSMEDQGVHVRSMDFRMPRKGRRVSDNFEEDPGQLVNATVVAVPLRTGKDGTRRCLEFFFRRTGPQQRAFERRTQQRSLSASIGLSIGDLRSEDSVNELILFGAIAGLGTRCKEVHLFSIAQDVTERLQSTVKKRLTLHLDSIAADKLKQIECKFLEGFDVSELPIIRGDIVGLLSELDEYEPTAILEEVLREQAIAIPPNMEVRLTSPGAFRIEPRCALVTFFGHNVLRAVLLLKSGQNSLISDEDLGDLTAYSWYVHYALVLRDLKFGYQKVAKELRELTEQLGHDATNMAYVGRVVVGLAHDLLRANQQVRRIKATLIGEIPAKRRQEIKLIIEEFDQWMNFETRCVKRLTSLSKVTRPVWGTYDLKKVVDDSVESFRYALDSAGVKLRVKADRLSEFRRYVNCDEFMIRQVLDNLIQNSLDWMPSRSKRKEIQIELYDGDARHVVIELKDKGPGIPPDIREEIFDPFFSLKPGKGMGMGTTIAKRIVKEVHNGKIEVFSAPQWGACFRITLPMKQAKKGG